MRIKVMSRSEAVLYCYYPHTNSAYMISISDPSMQYSDKPFCSADNKIIGILSLCFADADQPGSDVYGNGVGMTDLMSEEDAERIAALIKTAPDVTIIVHCDAGISRSAGVAAAIYKYCTGDDSIIFDNPRFQPNMWCYRKTLNALMKP